MQAKGQTLIPVMNVIGAGRIDFGQFGVQVYMIALIFAQNI